jgi:hypothetical protein
MAYKPTYKIYASNNSTLVYAIPYVLPGVNDVDDPMKYIEHTSLRGIGSIAVGGGVEDAWDLVIPFCLIGTSYENLRGQMDTLNTTIVKNTPYYLQVGLTASTHDDLKVKRFASIDWDKSTRRVNIQKGNLILRVNSW